MWRDEIDLAFVTILKDHARQRPGRINTYEFIVLGPPNRDGAENLASANLRLRRHCELVEVGENAERLVDAIIGLPHLIICEELRFIIWGEFRRIGCRRLHRFGLLLLMGFAFRHYNCPLCLS